MVALIPTAESAVQLAVAGGLPAGELHLTLCYLGDDVTQLPDPVIVAVNHAVRELVDPSATGEDGPVRVMVEGPLTLEIFAWSQFNPTGGPDGQKPCLVYQFDGEGDLNQVTDLAGAVQAEVQQAMGEAYFPEQHARFEPHVTAGYGLAPTALSYTGPVTFDRVRVALAGQNIDYPLGGDDTMTAAAVAPGTPAEIVEDTGDQLRIHWDALAVEGLDTGDGRYLTPGGGTHRGLPLSLLALPYKAHGGEDAPPAEVFGEITTLDHRPGPEVISKKTGQPFPEGTFVWSADAVIDGTHRFANLVRKGYLRGGSIDIADLDAELIDDETAALSEHPRRRAILHTYEIAAATMVPVPAFADAYCDLTDADVVEPLAASAMPAAMLTVPQPMWRSVDIGDPGVLLARTPSGAVSAKARAAAKKAGHTIPGTDSYPINNADDLTNAIRSVGRAKDPVKARKHIMSEARRLKLTTRIPDQWNPDGTTKDTKAVTAAALAATRPPLVLFSDPGFTEETPITVEDHSGWRRVFGHIGSWRRPHIGFNGKKVYLPKSRCDYAEFMRGGYRVDDNGIPRIVAVGHLTMDTGHADLSMAASSTAHHYDHTGFAWADVAAGEDAHGIWVAGVVKPWVTEDQLDTALAHPPSGDWRPIGGGLELVAVLCVNTPGFGIYRARVASGEVQAMVASCGIPPKTTDPVVNFDDLADRVADRILTRQQRAAAMSAQHQQLLAELDDRPDQMAELLTDLTDPASPEELAELGLTPGQLAAFDVSRMPEQLKQSYLHGKAAAKIEWGSDGDFARCVAEAVHHGIPGRMRKGMCSTLHRLATGKNPGQH